MPPGIPVGASRATISCPGDEPELCDDTFAPLLRLIEDRSFLEEGYLVSPKPVIEPQLMPDMRRDLLLAVLCQFRLDECFW